jgi:autoinducer 2-degrading protein
MRIPKSLIPCVLAVAMVPVLVSTRSPAEGAAKTAPDGRVCVDVLYTIRAGHEDEAVKDLRQLAAETRKEPGNLLYLAHRSLEDPRKFLIYEQYRSPAALEAHRAKDYFRRYSVQGLQKIAESHVTGTYAPL